MAEPTNPTAGTNFRMTIRGSHAGYPVEVELFGKPDMIPAAVSRLRELGIDAPAPTHAPAGQPKAKAERVEPIETTFHLYLPSNLKYPVLDLRDHTPEEVAAFIEQNAPYRRAES